MARNHPFLLRFRAPAPPLHDTLPAFTNPRARRYYRARYYHPGLARFIAEDPLQFAGGDVNPYVYVWNDPTRFVDPFGLWGFGIEGGGTAEVGAGPSGGAAFQAAS